MVHASYINEGNIYTVEAIDNYDCIINDAVTATVNVVLDDEDTYIDRMKQSVDQKLAYHIFKNSVQVGMVYNVVTNIGYEGACMYCKNDTIGMLIMFKTIFEIYDYHKIYVTPHTGGIKYFLSLATEQSIKEYHASRKPLTISRKAIESNGLRLFKYFNIVEL